MEVLAVEARPERGSAVTIGQFDGVHIGHRALLEATRERAASLGCGSAVVTFDRHPASVVRPHSAPRLLTDLDQKLELLADTGIDTVLVLPFDIERAAEPAEHFVRSVLVNRLGARAVVVGHDFHFGAGRRGDVDLLRSLGAELNFEVDGVLAVSSAEAVASVVSSTTIRRLLQEGEVAAAASLLGRPHEVRGLVVMGDGRGRELGYPTANVAVASEVQLPADGVYAGEYVLPDGTVHGSAISLGTRPQFYEDGAVLLEANVLDWRGDLYGQHARVRFVERLRGQQRFADLDALMVQMARDVEAARSVLAMAGRVR